MFYSLEEWRGGFSKTYKIVTELFKGWIQEDISLGGELFYWGHGGQNKE